jgi:DNA (cytosine-5)-methyltransferase 1
MPALRTLGDLGAQARGRGEYHVKPRLLDLYCGAGGAAVGYARAGFEVVGVDIKPQPNYPFEFIEADALDWLERHVRHMELDAAGWPFDAIHASPPCQFFANVTKTAPTRVEHENLIPPTRALLEATGLPFVIENVPEARCALRSPAMLCGSVVGLTSLQRHRLFETNWSLMTPRCVHHVYHGNQHPPNRSDRTTPARVVSLAGHGVTGASSGLWANAIGIDWMTRDEMAQAIPPAYTELIGHQLMQVVLSTRDASETQSA